MDLDKRTGEGQQECVDETKSLPLGQFHHKLPQHESQQRRYRDTPVQHGRPHGSLESLPECKHESKSSFLDQFSLLQESLLDVRRSQVEGCDLGPPDEDSFQRVSKTKYYWTRKN
jgi:hypothetical protein